MKSFSVYLQLTVISNKLSSFIFSKEMFSEFLLKKIKNVIYGLLSCL